MQFLLISYGVSYLPKLQSIFLSFNLPLIIYSVILRFECKVKQLFGMYHIDSVSLGFASVGMLQFLQLCQSISHFPEKLTLVHATFRFGSKMDCVHLALARLATAAWGIEVFKGHLITLKSQVSLALQGQCPNVSTTPIMAMGSRQCLPLSVVQLKGKHYRNPNCPTGVVDIFRAYNTKNSVINYFVLGKSKLHHI